MSPPTLEEVYATAAPLVAEAANRYRVEPGFFEDLVQEWVVGYAHGKHDDVVDVEHVRAALRRHFRHRAISRLRRPYKPVALQEGDEAVDGLDEEEREQRALLAMARDFVAELSGREQAVFKLVYEAELTHRQAAVRLGLSVSQVKSALYRVWLETQRVIVLSAEGRWCEIRRADLKAASGDEGAEEQVAKARWHLGHCDACGMEFQRLALRLRHPASALIPLPVMLEPGPVDRLHAALESIRGWWGALRGRAGETAQQLAGHAGPSTDTAERVVVGAKSAIAAICVTAAASASVCTVAGIPIPGLTDKPKTHHQRLERRAHPARKPIAVTGAAPALVAPHTASHAPRPKPATHGSLDPSAPRPPTPAPPGATELGPDSGGTNAPIPPAPADPQAGEVGP